MRNPYCSFMRLNIEEASFRDDAHGECELYGSHIAQVGYMFMFLLIDRETAENYFSRFEANFDRKQTKSIYFPDWRFWGKLLFARICTDWGEHCFDGLIFCQLCLWLVVSVTYGILGFNFVFIPLLILLH